MQSAGRWHRSPPPLLPASPRPCSAAEDAREFAQRLCAVAVERRSLAGSPQAALQEAHAAEQRLRGSPAVIAAKAAAVPTTSAQALSPASPDLLAALPRVGCKRPAATLPPQTLMTPAVKVGT